MTTENSTMERTIITELRLREEDVAKAVIFWLEAKHGVHINASSTVLFHRNPIDDAGISHCSIETREEAEIELLAE